MAKRMEQAQAAAADRPVAAARTAPPVTSLSEPRRTNDDCIHEDLSLAAMALAVGDQRLPMQQKQVEQNSRSVTDRLSDRGWGLACPPVRKRMSRQRVVEGATAIYPAGAVMGI